MFLGSLFKNWKSQTFSKCRRSSRRNAIRSSQKPVEVLEIRQVPSATSLGVVDGTTLHGDSNRETPVEGIDSIAQDHSLPSVLL